MEALYFGILFAKVGSERGASDGAFPFEPM